MDEEESEYWICKMCLHEYEKKIIAQTGAPPKLTWHTNPIIQYPAGVCDFCQWFPARTRITIKLPRFLMEATKPERMPPPAQAQLEERILWQLVPFIGENPFQAIAQRFTEFRKKATGLVKQAVEPVLLGEQEE